MASNVRILIADDHAVVRAGLKALLERQSNLKVIAEAGTGEEAVNLCKVHQPDVAVLDVRMPGISGIEACRQIGTIAPNTKVIILTSYAEDELLLSAIQAGAVGYMLKRIGDQELVRAVERVSRGDGILDPSMTATIFSEVRRSAQNQYIDAFKELTPQELSVLNLVAQGKTNRQVAIELFLGEGTVRNYVSSIFTKIGVSNRAEATAYAIKHNIQEVVSNS
ncbi:MAG: response regulator transcription factor [Phototrophicaceae bacterium]